MKYFFVGPLPGSAGTVSQDQPGGSERTADLQSKKEWIDKKWDWIGETIDDIENWADSAYEWIKRKAEEAGEAALESGSFAGPYGLPRSETFTKAAPPAPEPAQAGPPAVSGELAKAPPSVPLGDSSDQTPNVGSEAGELPDAWRRSEWRPEQRDLFEKQKEIRKRHKDLVGPFDMFVADLKATLARAREKPDDETVAQAPPVEKQEPKEVTAGTSFGDASGGTF